MTCKCSFFCTPRFCYESSIMLPVYTAGNTADAVLCNSQCPIVSITCIIYSNTNTKYAMCMITNIIIVIDVLLYSPPIFYNILNKTIIYLKVTPFIADCYAIHYNYNNIIVSLYT